MKRISINTAWLTAVVILGGCQPIIGVLQVRQNLPIQATHYVNQHTTGCTYGRDSDCQPQRIETLDTVLSTGTYPSELSLNEKSVRLSLKRTDGSEILLELPIPPGINVPQAAGRFQLTAAATGQQFDLTGDIDTQYGRSQSHSGWESCHRDVLRTYCGYGKKARCRHHYVTVYGERPVTYHYDIETKSVLLTLNEPTTGLALASFNGSQTHRNKRYEHAGYCHFHGYYPFGWHHY